jgi:hypothetical protein
MSILRSELGIGNHIDGGAISELHTQFATIQTLSGIRSPYTYDSLIPLPITEEYLLNVGFTMFDFVWGAIGYHITGLSLVADGDAYRMVKQRDRLSRPILDINHLENLYYSLTGCEFRYSIGEQTNIVNNGFRIGNRIEQGKVLELNTTHAIIQLHTGTISPIEYGSLIPIPFKAEDLPGMGFINNGSKWEKGDFYLLAEDARFYLRTDVDMYVTTQIMSLHQIQNLFFDMTGVVLPIGFNNAG